jgi:hypothetical protein
MRRTADTPFVAAPSETANFYSADDNALIGLHKMHLHVGSPADIAERPGCAAKG